MEKRNLILVSLTLVWCLGVVVQGFTYDEREMETEEGKLSMFERWRTHHNLEKISEKDKKLQYSNFKTSLKLVHTTNKANKSYKLEMNRFAGMSHAEIKSKMMGYKSQAPTATRPGLQKLTVTKSDLPFRYGNVTDIPPKIDWRTKGAVGRVKNQEGCGCCYAFAATCTVEGMMVAIGKQKIIELSPKELVDCANVGGCNGGAMTASFEWLSKNGGLTTMKNYPYVPKVEPCRVNKKNDVAVEVHGFEHVPHQNEEALMKAVAHQPVSVALHISPEFWLYKEGIMKSNCPTRPGMHAVVVVGYDTAPDGTKFWIIKNSWGEGWGEKGYLRMLRGVPYPEGYAGIALDASYPTLNRVIQPHESGPIVKSV